MHPSRQFELVQDMLVFVIHPQLFGVSTCCTVGKDQHACPALFTFDEPALNTSQWCHLMVG